MKFLSVIFLIASCVASAQTDSLPMHGELNQKQIDRYYPGILDTVMDRRIVASEPIDSMRYKNIYISILHNTGTFDQMFLCTHDSNFNLLDVYYIGKSTMFDGASHTIEYKKINDTSIEFHHVDWGWKGVDKDGRERIDALSRNNYILTISKSGKIIKK